MRLRRIESVLFVAGLALLQPSAPAQAEVSRGDEVLVDRVVAVVEPSRAHGEESEVVTRFELDVETRLVLSERARSLGAVAAEPPSTLVSAVLRTIVDQILIRREAERLELASVSDDEVARERAALESRLGGPGSLDRFGEMTGAPAGLIDAIVRRRATVARFIARNVALAVRVTDAEVAAAYAAGDHPFAGRPFDEVRDEVEAYVVALRQQQRLAEWLRDLRRRSRVRVLAE